MGSSANILTVLPEKPEHANLLDAEPKTDFNSKWLFKVNQCHLFRCQL